jgi:hypothetical protein
MRVAQARPLRCIHHLLKLRRRECGLQVRAPGSSRAGHQPAVYHVALPVRISRRPYAVAPPGREIRYPTATDIGQGLPRSCSGPLLLSIRGATARRRIAGAAAEPRSSDGFSPATPEVAAQRRCSPASSAKVTDRRPRAHAGVTNPSRPHGLDRPNPNPTA